MDFVSLLAVLNKSIDFFLLGALFLGIVFLNSRSLILSAEKEIEKEKKRVALEEKDRATEQGGQAADIKTLLQNPNIWIRVHVTGVGKAFYLWVISAIVQIIIFSIFWSTPDIRWFNSVAILIPAEALRWVELYVLLGGYIYLSTRKYGERRGLNSALGHLTVLLLGWLVGRWFGILFVSLPLLAIYYYVIYRFAEILLPASDPEDSAEKMQRFKILIWYMWGMQYPIIVVDDQTGMNVETRIQGSSADDIGMPGYIWTHMPQAIGLTGGISFSRVEGPGAIYTKKFERPQDVIDLRTQLRTTEVEAITQDGIPIKAVAFASFGVDRQPWEIDLYKRLKLANPMLRGGMLLDHGNSHFQYSRARIRAALSMEGVRTNIMGPVGSVSWRWDEQVMNMVAETARRVISEIPLSELWLPNAEKDGPEVSALDVIAAEISKRLAGTLQEQGVRLYAARVVNYFSLKDDSAKNKFGEFTHQQIPAWRARWEQQVKQKLAEADAEAEQKQMDATALARSMLLTSIAESLQKASANNRDLPRYLIAMRFLGALDDMIRQEPELASGEKGKALRERIAALNDLHLPKT